MLFDRFTHLMSIRGSIAVLLALATVWGGERNSAYGQGFGQFSGKPVVIGREEAEQKRGGPNSVEPGPAVIKPAAPHPQGPIPQPAVQPFQPDFRQAAHLNAQARTTLSVADSDASRLIHESRLAFDRGLLPLSDYVLHVRMASQLQFEASEWMSSAQASERQLSIAVRQMELLQHAVDELEKFDEPNAQGWAAELVGARMWLADAEAQVAHLQGNRHGFEEAMQRRRALEEKFYEGRLADFSIGVAPLVQLSEAARLRQTNFGPGTEYGTPANGYSDEQLSEYRDFLQQVVAQSEKLPQQGSGLARKDFVRSIQFDRASFDAHAAWERNQTAVAEEAFHQADTYAQQLLDLQWDYLRQGTVTLPDLTRSWLSRQELHESAIQFGYEVPPKNREELRNSLKRLNAVATQTLDRRGRNGADILLVRNLTALTQIRDLRAAEAVSRQNEGPEPVADRNSRPEEAESGNSKGKTAPRARVFDILPDGTVQEVER